MTSIVEELEGEEREEGKSNEVTADKPNSFNLIDGYNDDETPTTGSVDCIKVVQALMTKTEETAASNAVINQPLHHPRESNNAIPNIPNARRHSCEANIGSVDTRCQLDNIGRDDNSGMGISRGGVGHRTRVGNMGRVGNRGAGINGIRLRGRIAGRNMQASCAGRDMQDRGDERDMQTGGYTGPPREKRERFEIDEEGRMLSDETMSRMLREDVKNNLSYDVRRDRGCDSFEAAMRKRNRSYEGRDMQDDYRDGNRDIAPERRPYSERKTLLRGISSSPGMDRAPIHFRDNTAVRSRDDDDDYPCRSLMDNSNKFNGSVNRLEGNALRGVSRNQGPGKSKAQSADFTRGSPVFRGKSNQRPGMIDYREVAEPVQTPDRPSLVANDDSMPREKQASVFNIDDSIEDVSVVNNNVIVLNESLLDTDASSAVPTTHRPTRIALSSYLGRQQKSQTTSPALAPPPVINAEGSGTVETCDQSLSTPWLPCNQVEMNNSEDMDLRQRNMSAVPPVVAKVIPDDALNLCSSDTIDRLTANINDLEGIDFDLLQRNRHTWGSIVDAPIKCEPTFIVLEPSTPVEPLAPVLPLVAHVESSTASFKPNTANNNNGNPPPADYVPMTVPPSPFDILPPAAEDSTLRKPTIGTPTTGDCITPRRPLLGIPAMKPAISSTSTSQIKDRKLTLLPTPALHSFGNASQSMQPKAPSTKTSFPLIQNPLIDRVPLIQNPLIDRAPLVQKPCIQRIPMPSNRPMDSLDFKIAALDKSLFASEEVEYSSDSSRPQSRPISSAPSKPPSSLRPTSSALSNLPSGQQSMPKPELSFNSGTESPFFNIDYSSGVTG